MTDNFYEILGIKQTATREEIKQRYQHLARQLHPDKDLTSNDAEEFILIDKAWKTLGNEDTRRRYDAELLEHELSHRVCVQETIEMSDLDKTSDGRLTYPCRCGSLFEIEGLDLSDTSNCDDFVVQCSGCSLCIEIISKNNIKSNKNDKS